MTIADALASVQHRSVSYRDAEVFLSHILTQPRAYLHAHPEQRLTSEQRAMFEKFLKRREKNEPVAYIIGSKEFYGRPFKTDARALIPRPETEGMIEQALAFLPSYFDAHLKATNLPCPLRILELGTGSGNVAITLALELAALSLPATLIATDISGDALALAQENWQVLSTGISRHIVTKFICADLFAHPEISPGRPFDLIAANLPYVEATWAQNPAAQPDVVFHEPDVALFGGEDGLDLYRRFFAEAPKFLSTGGAVMIEHGEAQGADIRALAQAAWPNASITTYKDYADLDRITVIRTED